MKSDLFVKVCLISSGKSDLMQFTPFEITEAVKPAMNNLSPTKSANVYQAAYQKFIKWCEKKNVNNYSEIVLLTYFPRDCNENEKFTM